MFIYNEPHPHTAQWRLVVINLIYRCHAFTYFSSKTSKTIIIPTKISTTITNTVIDIPAQVATFGSTPPVVHLEKSTITFHIN